MKLLYNFFIGLLICGLFSCTHSKTEREEIELDNIYATHNSTYLYPEYKSIDHQYDTSAHFKLDIFDDYTYNPMVLSDTCNLYTKPINGINPFTTLENRTPITILNAGYQIFLNSAYDTLKKLDNKDKVYLYKVKNGKIAGYTQAENIVTHVFTDYKNKIEYLIKCAPISKNNTGKLRIFKYDQVAQTIIDSFIYDTYWRTPLIQVVKNHTLKNVDILFKISISGEACGIPSNIDFIANVNNKFIIIPGSSDNGSDAGDYDTRTVYLAFIDKKGKTILLSDFAFQNNQKSNLTIPYPRKLKIPLSDLIVLIDEQGEEERDENNEPILYNGEIKIFNASKIITYFKWSGRRLIKVKVSKHLL